MPKIKGKALSRVLVTCFEPYDEFPVNASQAATRTACDLWSHSDQALEVIWETLPVDFDLTPVALATLRDKHQPSYILHVGQAPGADSIRLEERAYNQRQGPLDPVPSPLLESEDAASSYDSQLPLEVWAETMKRDGLPVSVSQDAGRYLCNAVLYHSLHCAAAQKQPLHAAFVHVPLLPEQAADSRAPRPSLSADESGHVIYQCLQRLAELAAQPQPTSVSPNQSEKANLPMSQSPSLDEAAFAVAPGVLTVQQHILQEQQNFPGASGEFSWLLSGITIATKLIQAKVRRAGLSDILGDPEGTVNVQGEVQQKLDVFSNEVLSNCLRLRQSVGVLASEENEEPILVHQGSEDAKYAVIFDPLDGSSNIDVNVSVGTTFSVLRRPEGASLNDPEKWVLQPGRHQVAAGYVVYGSSTMLVYSVGNGVHGFTLEPSIGAFVLSHPNMQMPEQGAYYSVNEAKATGFPEPYQRYLQRLRSGSIGEYSSRYIGSMVADFHRTLLRGGIFLYPPTASHPSGKLRLLYEACPIGFLAEQAGGIAYDDKAPVLDQEPTSIHQRTPLITGSKREMEDFIEFMGL